MEILDLLSTLCDVTLLDEFCEPQNEGGHLAYSIAGQTFAHSGDGSEYILLTDGSIGYWGSSGQSGRLADSMEDFFELVVNCPRWNNYAMMYLAGKPPMYYYKDTTMLRDFVATLRHFEEELALDLLGLSLGECQKILSRALGVTLYEDITDTVLAKLYNSTTRIPRLITTYTEPDGSTHSASGVLIQDTWYD